MTRRGSEETGSEVPTPARGSSPASPPSLLPGLQVRGGAGPYEAAAVAAVVSRVLEEEAELRARRPAPAVPAAWVRVAQPAPVGRFVPPVLPDPGLNWPA